ncbi:MAG: decaprenyl-phosphate phosphoribosyltransferase [Anaerolineales bacterium]|nr:decaprenyl-phosphate phosphoribosyltransferase [Anaerolineales bacterium]
MITAFIKTMRPKQWIKNGLIFAALVFDKQLFVLKPFLATLSGFILLSLGASAVYFVNDIADLEHDRRHPKKRFRPLASGELPLNMARGGAVALFVIALGAGFALNTTFGTILSAYLVINLFYSFWLKHVPIIDVLVLALGFVLRVAAGVALITVQRFSPWLYLCITLLALFMGLGKRRAELVLMAEEANSHRRVFDRYTVAFLDQLIIIVSGTTIMAYSLYTFSAENLPNNHLMMLTIPFVIYGIFRYLYLINIENAGGAPEELVLSDWPLMATFVLWGLSAITILYLGT